MVGTYLKNRFENLCAVHCLWSIHFTLRVFNFIFSLIIMLQIVAERIHVRVFHRPNQTTAEYDIFRQRLNSDRFGRRWRSHYRKVLAPDPWDLHNRKIGADDPDFGWKGFQVKFFSAVHLLAININYNIYNENIKNLQPPAIRTMVMVWGVWCKCAMHSKIRLPKGNTL